MVPQPAARAGRLGRGGLIGHGDHSATSDWDMSITYAGRVDHAPDAGRGRTARARDRRGGARARVDAAHAHPAGLPGRAAHEQGDRRRRSARTRRRPCTTSDGWSTPVFSAAQPLRRGTRGSREIPYLATGKVVDARHTRRARRAARRVPRGGRARPGRDGRHRTARPPAVRGREGRVRRPASTHSWTSTRTRPTTPTASPGRCSSRSTRPEPRQLTHAAAAVLRHEQDQRQDGEQQRGQHHQ